MSLGLKEATAKSNTQVDESVDFGDILNVTTIFTVATV